MDINFESNLAVKVSASEGVHIVPIANPLI